MAFILRFLMFSISASGGMKKFGTCISSGIFIFKFPFSSVMIARVGMTSSSVIVTCCSNAGTF